MRKILLGLTLTVCVGFIQGQDCIEKADKAGFTYYSIPDALYSEVDSIRFLLSKPFHPENPTIVFLGGSGNDALISYMQEPSYSFNLLPPFSIASYTDRYNFATISKPGTPLCREWSDLPPPIVDTTVPDIMTFAKMDFLDYYVDQTYQVLSYMKKKTGKDSIPVFLIGPSQGGRVAIKCTTKYPNMIQKLVLYSSGVLDRHYEEISHWRQLADCKQISAEEAQSEIDKIYERYASLKGYKEHVDTYPEQIRPSTINYYSAITSYSYEFDIPLPYLLQVEIPVLCVYGTDDLKSRDNDMLPLFFERAGKKNLTMMPMLYCDHFFVERKPDEKTGEMVEKYLGDDVFAKIEKWFSNSN